MDQKPHTECIETERPSKIPRLATNEDRSTAMAPLTNPGVVRVLLDSEFLSPREVGRLLFLTSKRIKKDVENVIVANAGDLWTKWCFSHWG